jgi:hypothetical protein
MKTRLLLLLIVLLSATAADETPTATGYDDAVPVSAIDQEYDYVYNSVCPECGATAFVDRMQSLQFNDDTPYDVITAACAECGYERNFYFDVSALPWFSGEGF